MKPVLTATDLVVRRGDHTLLDRVSLALAPGRVTAVVGPNGAGKSTLLRLLSGELSPDGGLVRFLDRPLSAWPAAELARHRAVLPQESDLHFPFRVEEVVRLGRIPHSGGGDSAADHALARTLLARVDLTAFADRFYPTLSGGEKQRVHLARALAQLQPDPAAPPPAARALLLDEPTASLDLAHQHAVLALARDLARREHVAVLAILHDLNLVLAYADDLVVLSRGRVAASGPVASTLAPTLIHEVFRIPARLIDLGDGTPHQLLLGPAAL
ncbi:MAG: hemin transporter ATP-binding protein [Rariglobus sp.]|jgi:iron complex transport system ATP-binding protein|nr:hemin transporter ATP-binding protein [Rariglobus sp.]